jgi:hypothetical protein
LEQQLDSHEILGTEKKSKPEIDDGQVDHREQAASRLVAPCRDSSADLLSKSALDAVAQAVDLLAEADRSRAVSPTRDHRG